MDLQSLMPGAVPFSGLNTGALLLFVAWALVWKGLALWRAGRRGDRAWFVILLILNTMGIMEIIYYFLVAKTDEKKK